MQKQLAEVITISDIQIELNPYNQNQLCANVGFAASEPVKYSYTVQGKTADVDFSYSYDQFAARHVAPVAVLYGHYVNSVLFTVENEAGEVSTFTVSIDTTGQVYTDTYLTIDYGITDQVMADTTIGQGLMMTSYGHAYDRNGDLRVANLFSQTVMTPMVYRDQYTFVFTDAVGIYSRQLQKIDLMGQVHQVYSLPDEGLLFHHDITFGTDGSIFALMTRPASTDQEKMGCHICRFDNATGELLWMRDYSQEFVGSYILENGDTNDVHMNSLQYVEKWNQLMVNTRSTSTILGLDADTGDMVWIIDNPQSPVIDASINLAATGTNEMTYGCGEHCVYVTRNAKYAQYDTPDRIAITVFDNQSCKKEDGLTDNERLIEAQQSSTYRAELNARILVYGVDLTAMTVELLDVFPLPVRSEYRSAIYEMAPYYFIFACDVAAVFAMDADGNIGAQSYSVEPVISYWGRIYPYDQLRNMLPAATA